MSYKSVKMVKDIFSFVENSMFELNGVKIFFINDLVVSWILSLVVVKNVINVVKS